MIRFFFLYFYHISLWSWLPQACDITIRESNIRPTRVCRNVYKCDCIPVPVAGYVVQGKGTALKRALLKAATNNI